MESKIVALPQSNFTHIILDPLQSIQVECRQFDSTGLVTIPRSDIVCIIQWAYSDVVFFNDKLPEETIDAFPAFILQKLHRAFDSKKFEYYEVRFSEPHDEYFLMGVKNSMRFPLAQWRKEKEVRSLRVIIDDAAPLMHQCIVRHERMGRLTVFLGGAALALSLAQWRLELSAYEGILLLYGLYAFSALTGVVCAWFFLNYRKYLAATAIIMVENIEDEVVGAIYQ